MRKNQSHRQFSRAAVQILTQYPRQQVVAVLAEEIVRRRWVKDLAHLITEMSRELFRLDGTLSAEVTSATRMSAALQKRVAAALKSLTGATRVELTVTQDKNLIGGMIIRTPDVELDASLRGRLQRLVR